MTRFDYDGQSRRVRESLNGAEIRHWVWAGLSLAEERDAGDNVTRRFYAQGEQIDGQAYFYTRDHLGSVRELTDDSQVVRARYDYDPYGGRSVNQVTGNAVEASMGYTGHYFHASSGLHLAPFRAYDATQGRWISRDPIGENGGINLYGYVGNNALNESDPNGLIVDANYYISNPNLGINSGQLTLANYAGQQGMVVNMHSGSGIGANNASLQYLKSPDGATGNSGPIPEGQYAIVAWPDRHGEPAYALIPLDDSSHDRSETVDSPNGPVTRGDFLIHMGHPGGVGCIVTDRDDAPTMQRLSDFIRSSGSSGTYRVTGIGNLPYYGTLTVHP